MQTQKQSEEIKLDNALLHRKLKLLDYMTLKTMIWTFICGQIQMEIN